MSEKICISDMTLDRLTAYIVGLGSVRLRHRRSAAASSPGTAPSNIFWNWPMETASKPF